MTAPPRAVVADDDPDLLLLVSLTLEELGYEVTTAGDGDAALRAATAVRPELAVLDVAMPGLDGVEVTRRLRADGGHAGTTVVLLTARTEERDIEAGYDAGADAYITKPFSHREFEESVRRIRAERAEAVAHARTRELAAVEAAYARVAATVASEALPRGVFALVAEEGAVLTGAEAGRVLRYLPASRARVVGAWSLTEGPGAPAGPELVLDGTDAPSAVRASGRAARVTPAPPGRDHTLAVPVRVGGELWGALVVSGSRPEGLDHPEAATRLERFAHLVGLSLANAEARAQLALMATTDHLTGLPNQRTFHDRLAHEVARARRHARTVALVVFDIDRFKLVNDAHGHDAGNVVLAECARRLRMLVRSGETLARIGGEEFAWILPETDAIGAYAAAERARRAIRGETFPGVGTVTISAGICALPEATDSSELFRLADVALYWAKREGRDRVVRYTQDAVERFTESEAAIRRERAQALSGVRALARAVDAKDPMTQRHSERVCELVRELAAAAGWPAARIAALAEAALVHDVGKIGVPDQVLVKAGPLTPEEYGLVMTHAAVGAGILTGILSDEQCAWVRSHHERYDGTGYPDGLADGEITDGARLLAVADAWDAMTGARSYRRPMGVAEALRECRRATGTQFAPEAVAALEKVMGRRAAEPPPVRREPAR